MLILKTQSKLQLISRYLKNIDTTHFLPPKKQNQPIYHLFPNYKNNYYNMWNWLTRTKQELDTNHTYLRVEFLTTEEKSKKHQALKKLEKQYKND